MSGAHEILDQLVRDGVLSSTHSGVRANVQASPTHETDVLGQAAQTLKTQGHESISIPPPEPIYPSPEEVMKMMPPMVTVASSEATRESEDGAHLAARITYGSAAIVILVVGFMVLRLVLAVYSATLRWLEAH